MQHPLKNKSIVNQRRERSKQLTRYKPGDLVRDDQTGEVAIVIECYEELESIQLNGAWAGRWLMEPEFVDDAWHHYDIMHDSGQVELKVSEYWLRPCRYTAPCLSEDTA